MNAHNPQRARVWPVFGWHDPRHPVVAVFFSYGDAASFCGSEERTLHIAPSSPDKRTHGYRPAERDWAAEYRAWTDAIDNPPELRRTGTGTWA